MDERTAARFWGNVDKSGGSDACWLWKAHTIRNGYGRFSVSGRQTVAHRVAFEIARGPIPAVDDAGNAVCVCHSCDNRRCVNPAHLWLGTNADNVADRESKGRNRLPDVRGERNAASKLTAESARRIRELYAAGGISQEALARMFGVSGRAVLFVLQRKTWTHA